MKLRYLIARGLAPLMILAGCGAHSTASVKSQVNAHRDQDAATTAPSDPGLAHLEVLAPGELARKVYDAFGPNMTLTAQGSGQVDYLELNGSSFVGSISADPNNKYASSFSIGYFMALAGLSSVVAKNYETALYAGQPVPDCRTASGATKILTSLAPMLTVDELSSYAQKFQAACQNDLKSATMAVMQSYPVALKSTI